MDFAFQPVINIARKLIEARDEREIVRNLLQAIMDISGTDGASFVPLDDLGFPLAAQRLGEFPSSISDSWLEYLATPSVREKCGHCLHHGQVVQKCQLIDGPFSKANGVYCLPVRYAEHDLGILNLYMGASITPETLGLLELLIDTAALAIANDRLRRRELAMFSQFRSMRERIANGSAEKQLDQMVNAEDRLAEIEYRVLMEERTRLAREIHDGLAQTLGFLKLRASQLLISLEKNQSQQVQSLSLSLYDSLADAYLDVREAINMLRVIPGQPGGPLMGNWLHRMIEAFRENTSIQVDLVENSLQSSLPDEVLLQIIRIVQEALTNVRKHSQACHAKISCREVDHVCVVEVQDDGRGFSVDEVPEYSQHGLKGMRERASLIGADLQFISHPQQGTIVRLSLPILPEWRGL